MIGKTIGHYEITAKLGQGGMGEVYRATDTRLNRDVALKLLPEQFANDEQRMGRFSREAQVLASLNHPNIASIHGLEESNGQRVLVMELVEGEDLSARIERGPIPLDEALPIALQIAEALENAHEKGIIHRDLKPANIKLTPEGKVKVLDFGLAKALEDPVSGPQSASGLSKSPTLSIGATQAGVILGTAAYMSPEQAKGRKVDRRTDVWAFGVVLFEMLSGHPAFAGEDISDILANVLTTEPAWDQLPAETSPRVQLALRACLQRDPKQRLGDMQSVRLALEGAFDPVATADVARDGLAARRSVVVRALPWAMTAVLAGVLGIFMWVSWRSDTPAARPLVRANLDLPGFDGTGRNLALSPDGTRIAYVERGEDGKSRLATRLLAESEAKILADTEDASLPFFSPDGQWIGFGASGQLKKVLALGGAPLTLTDAPGFIGGSWAEDGFIVATVNVSGEMRRIPATGGAGETLVPPWSGGGIHPQVLPGGKKVIFTGRDLHGSAVKKLSLETKLVSTIIPGAAFAQYFPTNETTKGGATGHLVYRSGDSLLAAPFDPGEGELRGPAIPVLDDVADVFCFSSTGEIIYPIGTTSGTRSWPLSWLLPDGKTEPLLTEGHYTHPRVSPDGKLLAVTVDEDRATETHLVVFDWRNDRTLPLTEKGQLDGGAVWTPDSRYVIWAAPPTNGKRRFLWRRADGSGETHTLVESSYYDFPSAISPDGKFLALVAVGGAENNIDSLVAPLDLSNPGEMKLGEAEPLVRLAGVEVWPVFSPDGRWVAYFSDESGAYEVYVQRFPGGGGHRKVSEGGGIYPKWSANGQLLYFSPQSGRIMAVDYQDNGAAFVSSKPRDWSPTPIRLLGINDSWSLDPRGERAVVVPVQAAREDAGPPKVAYLLNFFDELRRRVPLN